MENINIDDIMLKIKENPLYIKDLESSFLNEHPEICAEAVRINASMLEFVPDIVKLKNIEMCIDALDRDIDHSIIWLPDKIFILNPELEKHIVMNDSIRWTETFHGNRPSFNRAKYIKEIMEKSIEIRKKLEDNKLEIEKFECIEIFIENEQLVEKIPYIKKLYDEFKWNEYKDKSEAEKQEFIIEMVEILRDENLSTIPTSYPEMCFNAVKKDYTALKYITEDIQNTKWEICLEAVKMEKTDFYNAIYYIADSVKINHPEICIEAVKKYGTDLFRIPEIAKIEHPEICQTAVKADARAIQYVPEKIQNEYPEICMEAVKKDGMFIKNVPLSVQLAHPEVCIEAVANNVEAINFVAYNIKNSIYQEVAKNNVLILKYIPESLLKTEIDISINALKNNTAKAISLIPESVFVLNPELEKYIDTEKIPKEDTQTFETAKKLKNVLSQGFDIINRCKEFNIKIESIDALEILINNTGILDDISTIKDLFTRCLWNENKNCGEKFKQILILQLIQKFGIEETKEFMSDKMFIPSAYEKAVIKLQESN